MIPPRREATTMNSSRSSKSVDQDAIEAMAAAWLAQRDEGFEAGEADDFARWQAADPRHAAAVARLERTWSSLQQLRDFRPAAVAHPDRDLLTRATPGPRAIWAPALAAGALAVVAFMFWQQRTVPTQAAPPPLANILATTVEGYERVTLADGSVVELNSSSEVRVDYTPAARHLHLLRGEAHFTVQRNPDRPFLVHAGAVAVRAVGTEFSVRLADSRIEVLVTEGRVKLQSDSAPAPAVADAPTLGAGQRAFIPAAPPSTPPDAALRGVTVESVSSAAIRELLAWQGPRLVFVETPLREVIEQFNRRNSVQLVLADEELGALSVGGSFRPDNLDAFVRLLTADREIVAERPTADRVVLHRPR
jgi:transmembrane sensor